ncbi:hypothetical protein HKX48_001309 [Thoreauomyces humboldtii]|nr:hypothetical protein HKX48_001309 [Thoreauomyces humboldtii]
MSVTQPQTHTAIIMGATGACGKALVREVMTSSSYSKVTLLLRKELPYDGVNKEKLVQKIVDFEKLDESVFQGHDTIFCTFGTTKAQAGSAEAFQRIDRDYVLAAAKLFRSANPSTPLHFLYVSSGGASSSSWMLYPKTKGEIEDGLKAVGFEKVSIFRPAFLITEEKRNQSRLAEDLLHPVMNSWFGRATGFTTPVGAVAKAMREVANGAVGTEKSSQTYENKEILALGA